MPADLHVHTYLSDGTDTPEEIVGKAAQVGLKTVAITDHDTLAGNARAISQGRVMGIEVIPGLEFTTEVPAETEIHILGYWLDGQEAELNEAIERIQQGRTDRLFKICEKLAALGLPLAPERVLAIAGHRVVGRPHVARALVEKKYVGSLKEAFDRYLGFHGPAYVAHYKLSPAEAVRLITTAGGLPVYAHPAVSNYDQIIPELMAAGLVGLECYYIGHNQNQTNRYLELAQKYGLLVTGGSDYHGSLSGREVELGTVTIKDELMDKLRNEYLRRN